MMASCMMRFVIVLYIFGAAALRVINRTEINNLSSTGCLLLGLEAVHDRPSLVSALEELCLTYKEEPMIHIALGSRDDVTWSKPHSAGEDPEVAFYKRQPPNRSCLLSQVWRRVAVPYSGQFSLDMMVSFLNEHCNVYRQPSGGLEAPGILQRILIDNLYRLKDLHDSCQVVDTLSQSQFFWNHLSISRPVVIRGAAKHWVALTKWTMNYLHGKYGHKMIHIKMTQDGVFEGVEPGSLWPGYSDNWIPDNVRKQLTFPNLVVVRPATDEMTFGEFLELVSLGRNKSGVSSYLEYSSIPSYLPELEADIEELSFVKNLLQRRHLNIWLSDGDTLGKLHFDPFDNFLCQLSGEKHLTLFEPYNNKNLYEAHIPEALLGYDKEKNKVFRKKLLQSTSMVMSPVDIVQPDYQRFPLFKQARRIHCVLRPGDVLFMPAFWWHEVQSYPDAQQQRNLAINYWYEPFFTKEFPCPECKLEINPVYKTHLTNPPPPVYRPTE